MKLSRLIFVCSLLLLAASPVFAIGCRSCDGPEYPYCISTPDSGTRCQIGIDYCFTQPSSYCTGFSDETAAPAVLAEWTVASIEITRPTEGTTKVVTAPAAVADANVGRDTLQK